MISFGGRTASYDLYSHELPRVGVPRNAELCPNSRLRSPLESKLRANPPPFRYQLATN